MLSFLDARSRYKEEDMRLRCNHCDEPIKGNVNYVTFEVENYSIDLEFWGISRRRINGGYIEKTDK